MTKIRSGDRQFARTISQIIGANPFLPDRPRLEREALGQAFVKDEADWNLHPSAFHASENTIRLQERAEAVLERMRVAIETAAPVDEATAARFTDLSHFVLFGRYRDDLRCILDGKPKHAAQAYERFQEDFAALFEPDGLPPQEANEPTHIFAVLYQIYRAFHHLFDSVIGCSECVIRLRANVWESIFTHDLQRYRKTLFARMLDFSTLVTGPSGTGKELVARAIGLSTYIPFDEQRLEFACRPDKMFISLNLSSFSPTLIESELFGHKKGAFTGADRDRIGWLESCPPGGVVFLDEIGELDEVVQVKLLRVLQEREFKAVGDVEVRRFRGRIVAATNRDLSRAISETKTRADFIYRIRSDSLQVPRLAQRCQDDPQELAYLVHHLLKRITGDLDPALGEAILSWIGANLGTNYSWPGNVRELEQCIRSYLIRRNYRPLEGVVADDRQLDKMLRTCGLTADQLLNAYCHAVYSQTQSYVATAKQLGIDRRTVRSRVERPSE
jgi:transcriptional regulator with AAA-type ATPase domain